MKKVIFGMIVLAISIFIFTKASFNESVSNAAGGKTVTLSNNMFAPKTVTIKKGDSVTWSAKDGAHTVKADNGSFQSGTITAGKNFSHTFDAPGTYGYHCTFHGSPGHDMAGKVIVTK